MYAMLHLYVFEILKRILNAICIDSGYILSSTNIDEKAFSWVIFFKCVLLRGFVHYSKIRHHTVQYSTKMFL